MIARRSKLEPKDAFKIWLSAQRQLGRTLNEIRQEIGPTIPERSLQEWAQNRSLPPGWVCGMILDRIGVPYTRGN